MIVRRGVRGGFWLHCCSAVLQLRKGQKIRTTGNQDDAWQVISRFSKNPHVPPGARVLGTLPCTSPSLAVMSVDVKVTKKSVLKKHLCQQFYIRVGGV